YLDSPVIGKPFSEPFEGEPAEVMINGTIGRFQEGKDENQTQWIENRHAYTITGTPDKPEMLRMAGSLVHVNDQLMKTLPQKGVTLAEPLTASELTSIIMPESWILIHNRKTTPGIIDIRLPAQEFHESFANSTLYPDFLVYRNTSSNERVALFQIPKNMFEANNPDPAWI